MHDIRNMCMTYDILFLQETWLSKTDNALKDVDDNFDAYLPYQCADNFEDYCNCLGKIAAIVHEADTRNIVITGDFNAGVNTLFEHELVELCKGEH